MIGGKDLFGVAFVRLWDAHLDSFRHLSADMQSCSLALLDGDLHF